MVAESSEDLKEDPEEEGQPVQERTPYVQRTRRVRFGPSQLRNGHYSQTVTLFLPEKRQGGRLEGAFGYQRICFAQICTLITSVVFLSLTILEVG